jgi:hypothetical protein
MQKSVYKSFNKAKMGAGGQAETGGRVDQAGVRKPCETMVIDV